MSSTNLKSRDERADTVREWAKKQNDKGLSIRVIADALGVSKGAVQGLLDGTTPQDDTLGRMEAALAALGASGTQPVPDAGALATQLDGISERAKGDPFVWIAQVEALAAAYRGRAVDRMAEAWREAEGAALERAAAMARDPAQMLELEKLPPKQPAKKEVKKR